MPPGKQAQKSNTGYVDGHDPQAGWLYQLYPANTDATKPAGEWNQLRVLITPESRTIHEWRQILRIRQGQ